jgi:hypothetical protein
MRVVMMVVPMIIVVVMVIHIKPAFSCAKSITQLTILYI